MDLTTIKVDGMSCGHCVATIESELNKMGVTGKVDLKNKEVTVNLFNSNVTTESIKEMIEKQGYTVL
ncbi:cation transporter [Bacillus cereus]|uniref:cation transporter n=1 Tax=Bacillus cereus TaxID=1396 RepID=UPI000BEE0AF8|nr:cation transporter [Bacillus cereus]PEF61674.1 copper resistance protein CopZ [Bacillus cereus]